MGSVGSWPGLINDFQRLDKISRQFDSSICVAFAESNLRIDHQVEQLVLVKPGASYRLHCFVRAADLKSPEGPRIAVAPAAATHDLLAQSEPVATGTSDWRELTVDFVVPPNVTTMFVSIKRTPKFSFDQPTSGTVWFDGFTLTAKEGNH